MATAKNDITGDSIASKTSTEAFRNNFEAAFGTKDKPDPVRQALEEPQQITHVAIKYANKVFSLPAPNRHHDVIRMIGGISGPDVQGFLDANGVFLNRKQAFEVATQTGQIKRPDTSGTYQGPQLFSEDLW
jgi:hypothetical protein